MKRTIVNTLLYTAAVLVLLMTVVSCGEDDLPNKGNPIIEYVRVTSPESSDSLLVAAYQGSMVAIIGHNLGKAEQVWFNDLKADLSPVYVTNTTIITTVPSDVPTVVSDQLKLVFANGDTLNYDFEVSISEPVLNSMKSEYVFEGDIAVLRGNYFYEPLTVTFSGGVEGTVVSPVEDATRLEVVVPDGAQPGPITVTTNFGEVTSDFWFRDNRNIILGSDPFAGWWNESFVVYENDLGADDPTPINGNYIRVNMEIGAWSWTEVAGGPASATGDVSKNFPDEAFENPAAYNFKFEINTLLPYDNNMIRLNFGLPSEVNEAYFWSPPYDSEGAWETVVIPLEEMFAAYEAQGVKPTVNPDGYWTRILIFDGNALDCDIAFDNFRVVPKTLD